MATIYTTTDGNVAYITDGDDGERPGIVRHVISGTTDALCRQCGVNFATGDLSPLKKTLEG